ncbi:hypothetical protein GCM10007860_17820 [Chitiniphilus shinanonensis]|uniref:Polysaccharide pyruvyl transferase domain-containing protein n=1 Tax=Chitiniphilus shinanonensis TaxID=553088 RepID=A0ABQ6BRM3_9NEIS|nr:polysaccharide pyruvyl transferase family protein [Chitiniphilus shinanonensis]GLS04635.1 hypothetical protein GCM10007860_17820 [Chitiniphilus shinanonensis]
MKHFYLTGQDNFGNRGCEALTRSNAYLLRQVFPGCEVMVPSFDMARDSRQWPSAADDGVRFVPAIPLKSAHRWWGRLSRRAPVFKSVQWPMTGYDATHRRDLDRADALISIGGDNYSLDYGLVSLFHFVNIAEYTLRQGKPATLWGASVGPFDKEPRVVPQVMAHLDRLSMVSVRETVSYDYLRRHGLSRNLHQVADSAFWMLPEPIDLGPFWSRSERPVLGLNISSLIHRYRPVGEARAVLQEEAAAFVRQAVDDGYHVMLIPHVASLDGNPEHSDEAYLKQLYDRLGQHQAHVGLVPSGLNAPQLKYVISQCRFFIGARTHATIAALSTRVPTCSIAYSVKAKGINADLFGHTEYVLETPLVSTATLSAMLRRLEQDETTIKARLEERVPVLKQQALDGVRRLATLL